MVIARKNLVQLNSAWWAKFYNAKTVDKISDKAAVITNIRGNTFVELSQNV